LVSDTAVQDNIAQSFSEGPNGTAGMSALDVTYSLFTPANPVNVSDLSLYYSGSWTGNAEGDTLKVFIKTGADWQDITADLLATAYFRRQ